MHYRNGREAKNGDTIISLTSGKIDAFGVLFNAQPGSDYCNGCIAPIHTGQPVACLCDCLHVDDVLDLIKSAGLHVRPAGK